MSKCNCDMRTKLVGDGCEVCNPARALEYAKDRIEELENPWISVDERLPEGDGWYLVSVMTPYGRSNNADPLTCLSQWGSDRFLVNYVTDWQPLPPPPNREVNKK